MYPQSHFLFSFFIGTVFVKLGFFDYKIALFIAIIGMLIDIDHYFVFLSKKKYRNHSPKHAFNLAVKGIYRGRSFIHKRFGFILITAIILSLFYTNKTLFWIFGLGYYSHIFLDYMHLNILKIRGNIVINEFGFVEKIGKFEVMLDIFLAIAIFLLIW